MVCVFTRMRQVIMPDADYTGFVDATDGFDGGDGQVRRNHACWHIAYGVP